MGCVVPGCSHRMGGTKGISFHRFPGELELKRDWIENIKREKEWTPSEYSRICSAHFEESCFRTGYNRRVLHSHAVPTLFVNHPLARQPILRIKREAIAKYDAIHPSPLTASATTNKVIPCPPGQKSQMCQTESNNESVEEFIKITKLVKKYKTLAAIRRRKLKNLQRKCLRLEKKYTDFETIIQTQQEEMERKQVTVLILGDTP